MAIPSGDGDLTGCHLLGGATDASAPTGDRRSGGRPILPVRLDLLGLVGLFLVTPVTRGQEQSLPLRHGRCRRRPTEPIHSLLTQCFAHAHTLTHRHGLRGRAAASRRARLGAPCPSLQTYVLAMTLHSSGCSRRHAGCRVRVRGWTSGAAGPRERCAARGPDSYGWPSPGKGAWAPGRSSRWPSVPLPSASRICAARAGRCCSRPADPSLMVGCDMQTPAMAAAEDTDACPAFPYLKTLAGRVQQLASDQNRRAQPGPVLFPVAAGRGGTHLGPVFRVPGKVVDAAAFGRSGRHLPELGGRDRLQPPGDLPQVDGSVVVHE